MSYKKTAIAALTISINATLLSFTPGVLAKDANPLLGEWLYLSCQGQGKAQCDNYAGTINKEFLSMKFFQNGVRVHNGDIITIKKYNFFDNVVKLDSDSAISSLQFTVNGDNMSINARNLISSETYILTMARKGSKAASNAPASYISQQQAQLDRAPVVAAAQRSVSVTTIPGKRLFGTWRIDSCDYWRGTERLANTPCKTTGNDVRVEFKSSTMSFNGKERAVDYVDGSDWVDVREPDGEVTRHFIHAEQNALSIFTDDKANNRKLRLVALKIAGVPDSGPAPSAPKAPESADGTRGVKAGDIVPLKRGYYVSSNVPCNKASNASLSLFTGKSFSDWCKVVSNKKINDTTYAIKSKCQIRDESLSISSKYVILSPVEYKETNQNGEFQSRYCEQSQLPDPWRDNDIKDIVSK
jgi:hypothetical protein